MQFLGLTDGPLHVRPLQDSPADVAALTRWLSDPVVLEFYEGRDNPVMDPVVTNARAIRAYEKCGFRKVKLLPQHELHEGAWRDAWLLENRRG